MNELIRQLQQIYVLLDAGDRLALRPIGLTPTQFNVLRSVDERSSDSPTITRLSESMLCTRGNATRLVRRLHDMGLVTTQGQARDQRLVFVSLTREGRRRLALAREVLDEAARRYLGNLPANDVRALTALTKDLADALRHDPGAQDPTSQSLITATTEATQPSRSDADPRVSPLE